MPQNVSATTIYGWKNTVRPSPADCPLPCSSSQGISSFAWSLSLILFNQYLNMMFDAPECLYHYYLCVENSARATASSWCFTSSPCFLMQLKPRNQQFCLVIISDTLQPIPRHDFLMPLNVSTTTIYGWKNAAWAMASSLFALRQHFVLHRLA